MKKKPLPKERNPFVAHMVKRKAGAHGLSPKAQRKREKETLKKGIAE